MFKAGSPNFERACARCPAFYVGVIVLTTGPNTGLQRAVYQQFALCVTVRPNDVIAIDGVITASTIDAVVATVTENNVVVVRDDVTTLIVWCVRVIIAEAHHLAGVFAINGAIRRIQRNDRGVFDVRRRVVGRIVRRVEAGDLNRRNLEVIEVSAVIVVRHEQVAVLGLEQRDVDVRCRTVRGSNGDASNSGRIQRLCGVTGAHVVRECLARTIVVVIHIVVITAIKCGAHDLHIAGIECLTSQNSSSVFVVIIVFVCVGLRVIAQINDVRRTRIIGHHLLRLPKTADDRRTDGFVIPGPLGNTQPLGNKPSLATHSSLGKRMTPCRHQQ